MKPFAEVMLKQMMFMDGAMHTRLRGICAAAFTPRRVEQMRTMSLSPLPMSSSTALSPQGEIDMITDFANPLPAIVTAKLLGVPVEDHQQLHAWVLDLAEVLGNYQHHPDRVAEIVKSLDAFKNYIADGWKRKGASRPMA
jgi:pimeloyl-[acyl-carrier protein] synthase